MELKVEQVIIIEQIASSRCYKVNSQAVVKQK